MICLEDVLKTSLQDVLKTSLQDVLKTFSKCLEDVLKTFWSRLGKTSSRRMTKTKYWSWPRRRRRLWRRVTKANIFVLIKTSWKHLLKTKTREETSLQDVFKTFSRRLHQDECLLGILINQVLSWNYQKNIWT